MDNGIIGKERFIVGLVVFDGERFLLLHRNLHWKGWEFPKGGIEEKETHEEAVARELCEETGITKYNIITKLDDFKFYDKSRKVNSYITNYLVQVSSNSKVTLNNAHELDDLVVKEHDDFKWFFPEDALKTITHTNQRETLKLAIDYLGLEG